MLQITSKTAVAVVGAALLLLFASAQVVAIGEPAASEAYENITAVPIPMASSTQTIIGQDFVYPTGSPLIKGYLIDIPVDKETSLHLHTIPLLGYVVSGTLEVDYGSKGKFVIEAGNAFVEAIEWCHIGRVVGDEPVKVMAFYLSQTTPETPLAPVCDAPN